MGKKKVKKTRWVKKGAGKSKGWRKTGRKRVVKRLSNFQGLKMGSQVWPAEYRTCMTTYAAATITDTAATTQLTWYGNSFGDGTTVTNGVGPATGGAAPFTRNYPAGLKGLIQTPAAAGTAICPYTQYRILSSKIFYRVVPAIMTAGNAPACEIRSVVFPSTQLDYTGTAFAVLVEQQRAKFNVISPGYFGTATTTAITGAGAPLGSHPEKMLTNSISTAVVYGVKSDVVNVDNQYWNTVSAVCQKPWYWQMVVTGDGAGHYACFVEVIVKHDTIFFNRNYDLASTNNN